MYIYEILHRPLGAEQKLQQLLQATANGSATHNQRHLRKVRAAGIRRHTRGSKCNSSPRLRQENGTPALEVKSRISAGKL